MKNNKSEVKEGVKKGKLSKTFLPNLKVRSWELEFTCSNYGPLTKKSVFHCDSHLLRIQVDVVLQTSSLSTKKKAKENKVDKN